MAEWAERAGIPYKTLRDADQPQWRGSVEDALTF